MKGPCGPGVQEGAGVFVESDAVKNVVCVVRMCAYVLESESVQLGQEDLKRS